MTAFDVRCDCGAVVHTSKEHIGRTISCRCGRRLTIEAPKPASATPDTSAEPAANSTHSGSRAKRRAERAKEMFVLGRDEVDGARQRQRQRQRGGHFSAAAAEGPARRSTRKPFGVSTSWLRRIALAASQRGAHSILGIIRELTHHRAATRYVSRAMVAYLLAVVAAWALLLTTSERWLPATALLYGPRLAVLVPLPLLLAASLLFARRSAFMALPALFVGLYGIMGFRFGIALPVSAKGPTLRVMSFNAQGGGMVAGRIDDVLALEADVIGIQECSEPLADSLRARGKYTVLQSGAQCTASRWPVIFLDSMPRLAFQRIEALGYGGSGRVLRYRIQHPSQPFQLVNLHLETPRKGLSGMTGGDGLIPDDGDFSRAVPDAQVATAVDANTEIRLRESERASGWIASKRDEGPLVITGDFNQPVESTIFREYWSPFTDAFEAVGRGFGYTKFEGTLLRARIDHVLVWPTDFVVARVFVGPDVGSDHRPLVAELRFR